MKNDQLRKYFLTAVILLVLTMALQATQLLNFSAGVISESTVRIAWSVADENGVDAFIIKRSHNGVDFTELSSPVAADGSLFYEHLDTPYVFNKTETDRTFFYRLCIRDDQGVVHNTSDIVEVNLEISGITLTWGTLKAMFR